MTVYSKGINNVASTNAGAKIFSLTSTEEEKKRAVRIVITDIIDDEMLVDVDLEREKIVDALPLEMALEISPELIIELGVEIPVGQTLEGKLKPSTAGSQGKLVGWIEYEIMG